MIPVTSLWTQEWTKSSFSSLFTAGNLLTRNNRLWKREREKTFRLWWRRRNITASNGRCATSNIFYGIYLKNIKKVRMSCDAGIIFQCSRCQLKGRGLLKILNFTLQRQQEGNILNRMSNSALFNRFFMHKQLKFRVSFMHTVITKMNKPMFYLWARRQSILIKKNCNNWYL